ncbi:hypothetical protein E8E13_004076 [Curvularia kusanoi]|nr:hypothetical protein E8E13_004076 [Curvularia kusanoi]
MSNITTAPLPANPAIARRHGQERYAASPDSPFRRTHEALVSEVGPHCSSIDQGHHKFGYRGLKLTRWIAAKSRTIMVRLISMAMTGYYRTMQRPRAHQPLSMLKYDPIVRKQVLFLEAKRGKK